MKQVNSFKYMGIVITDGRYATEVKSRVAHAK